MSNGTRIIRAPRGAGTIRCTARLHGDGHHVATGAAVPRAGVQNTFDIRGFVPEYVRPLYCDGIGPFGGAALSGDPDDIALTDAAARVKTLQTRLVVPVDRAIMIGRNHLDTGSRRRGIVRPHACAMIAMAP